MTKRWLPGVAVLAAMLGTGGLVGMNLGLRFWPVFVALALAGFAVVTWLTHVRMRRPPAPSRRSRGRRRGAREEYDLEADTSTDEQRWLM